MYKKEYHLCYSKPREKLYWQQNLPLSTMQLTQQLRYSQQLNLCLLVILAQLQLSTQYNWSLAIPEVFFSYFFFPRTRVLLRSIQLRVGSLESLLGAGREGRRHRRWINPVYYIPGDLPRKGVDWASVWDPWSVSCWLGEWRSPCRRVFSYERARCIVDSSVVAGIAGVAWVTHITYFMPCCCRCSVRNNSVGSSVQRMTSRKSATWRGDTISSTDSKVVWRAIYWSCRRSGSDIEIIMFRGIHFGQLYNLWVMTDLRRSRWLNLDFIHLHTKLRRMENYKLSQDNWIFMSRRLWDS